MKRLFRIYKPFTRAGLLEMVAYRVNFLFFLLGEIIHLNKEGKIGIE